MPTLTTKAVKITIDSKHQVSGLLELKSKHEACLVLAHGAGAGMNHMFMQSVAAELSDRGIATLRYQFPYMEAGNKRPDSPKLAQATVRAAVEEAARQTKGLPLFAGGKSFGGRMTSQAQALSPLPGVKGLVFFGFPLHAAGKPSDQRGEHLSNVKVPMLFLQGTRDALADLNLLKPLVKSLGKRATLELAEDADHSFHVPARTGRKDPDIRAALLDMAASWMKKLTAS